MPTSSGESYLVSAVMTATPQRLQLMLTETVIRLIESARQRWRTGEHRHGVKALVRAQQIVGELPQPVRHAQPDLAQRRFK